MKKREVAHTIIELFILALLVGSIVHYFTTQLEIHIWDKVDTINNELENIWAI